MLVTIQAAATGPVRAATVVAAIKAIMGATTEVTTPRPLRQILAAAVIAQPANSPGDKGQGDKGQGDQTSRMYSLIHRPIPRIDQETKDAIGVTCVPAARELALLLIRAGAVVMAVRPLQRRH